jgi:hypothetical protein
VSFVGPVAELGEQREGLLEVVVSLRVPALLPVD